MNTLEKPGSAVLFIWMLFIVGMTLLVFIPPLYKGQKHIRPVVEKTVACKLVIHKSLPEKHPAPVPENQSAFHLPEKHPAPVPEDRSLYVHGTKAELLFHPMIQEAANRYQVDPALVKAIIMAESGYNPRAISKKGAKGLMQLMPRTAKALGVEDSFNPEHNINAGVRYFKQLMNQFNGDAKLALAAYNAGSRKVRQYQGIPPFKATQYYIKKVFIYYQYYRKEMAMEINRA